MALVDVHHLQALFNKKCQQHTIFTFLKRHFTICIKSLQCTLHSQVTFAGKYNIPTVPGCYILLQIFVKFCLFNLQNLHNIPSAHLTQPSYICRQIYYDNMPIVPGCYILLQIFLKFCLFNLHNLHQIPSAHLTQPSYIGRQI